MYIGDYKNIVSIVYCVPFVRTTLTFRVCRQLWGMCQRLHRDVKECKIYIVALSIILSHLWLKPNLWIFKYSNISSRPKCPELEFCACHIMPMMPLDYFLLPRYVHDVIVLLSVTILCPWPQWVTFCCHIAEDVRTFWVCTLKSAFKWRTNVFRTPVICRYIARSVPCLDL